MKRARVRSVAVLGAHEGNRPGKSSEGEKTHWRICRRYRVMMRTMPHPCILWNGD